MPSLLLQRSELEERQSQEPDLDIEPKHSDQDTGTLATKLNTHPGTDPSLSEF